MFSAAHPITDFAKILRHVRFVPCVDGSGLAREIFTSQAWSVLPCVRPVEAAHMTAGHNALRGSGPGQKPAFDNALAQMGCPDRRIDRLCARLFPEVKSSSLEPGWVPNKMGGAGAPDDIEKAHRTKVWLATSDEPAATVSGRYQKLRRSGSGYEGRRTTGSVARPMSESFRHCFEGAVTEGGSMSWYIDIDEGKR